MLGRTGLSGMRWDIQMDRVAESNSSTGYGCEVTQKTRRDLKDGFDKVLIMHCEKTCEGGRCNMFHISAAHSSLMTQKMLN